MSLKTDICWQVLSVFPCLVVFPKQKRQLFYHQTRSEEDLENLFLLNRRIQNEKKIISVSLSRWKWSDIHSAGGFYDFIFSDCPLISILWSFTQSMYFCVIKYSYIKFKGHIKALSMAFNRIPLPSSAHGTCSSCHHVTQVQNFGHVITSGHK